MTVRGAEPDLSCYYSGALRELSRNVVVGAERVGAVPLLHENVCGAVVGGLFCGLFISQSAMVGRSTVSMGLLPW